MLPPTYWITVGVTAAALVICVVLHYEALRLISDRLPTPANNHRLRDVFLVLCLIGVHIIEIWVFGLAYYGLLQTDASGSLVGLDVVTIFDCVYYSAVVFTTLGFGDIVPEGPIRFMTGTEAAAGLTFITWSASYMILDMMKVWDDQRTDREKTRKERPFE